MKKTLFFLATLIFSFSNVNCQNALHLDGVDDFVNLNSIAPGLQGQNTFTIEFWMKADLDSQSTVRSIMFAINKIANPNLADNQILLVVGGPGTTQDGKLIVVDQGITPNNFPIVSNQIIGDDSCHHIAYVYNNGVGEAFLDGVSIGTHTDSFTLTSSHRYSIGQEYDNLAVSNFYNGSIDDLRIWSTARSAVQIANNMNMVFSGNEPGLLGFYNFDQGVSGGVNTTVNTLTDLTGNNYDGSLNGFALNGNRSNWVSIPCINNFPESVHDQLHLEKYFKVYPNPASSSYHIESLGLVELESIKLSNHLGQRLIDQKLSGPSYEINLEHFSSGVYYLRIESTQGVFLSKLVKN